MTFDDGPSAEYTPRLLDMLKARHIKATFFLVGKNAQAPPELVRRIIVTMPAALDGLIAEGYHLVTISRLIALESHPAFIKVSAESWRRDPE